MDVRCAPFFLKENKNEHPKNYYKLVGSNTTDLRVENVPAP
jgi:hypothetical protein